MKARLSALFGLCGLVACSSQNPPESAYDTTASRETAPSELEPGMRPASLEERNATSSTAPQSVGPTSQTGTASPVAPSTVQDPPPTAAPPAALPAPDDKSVAKAPDNTKVNERDRNNATLTPTDQNENQTDLKITQQIRQAVMADGSLSFTAKNVKIITQGGKVTLRGPVKTAEERAAIESAARKAAGVTNVDNQLEIKK